MEEKSIYEIRIYGKIPCVLLLEDTLDEKFQPDFDNVIPIVTEDGDLVAGLFFKKMLNQNQGGDMILVMEDLFGEFSYSKFCLIINDKHTKNLKSKISDKDGKLSFSLITQLTAEILNKFISIYKIKTQKAWIPKITYKRLSPYEIFLFDKDSDTPQRTIIDYRGTGDCLGVSMTQEDLVDIKKQCSSHLNIDRTYNYLEEAKRFLLTGDYEAFTIFLAFYVESWIYREIGYKWIKNGKSDEEINNIFDKYIYPNDILKYFLGTDNFKLLQNTIQYQNYRLKVANKRNDIAHRRKNNIDEKIADDMVKTSMDYRDYLFKIIWEDIKIT